MALSNGDVIAIMVGSAAIIRWGFDMVTKFMGNDRKDDVRNVLSIAQVKSDLAAHQAKDDVMFQWIKDSIHSVDEKVDKMDRKLDNLQAQIRFVATQPPQRITELGRREDKDGN